MYFLSKRQTFLPVDTVQVVPLHINVGEVASTERRVISRGGDGDRLLHSSATTELMKIQSSAMSRLVDC